MPKSRHDPDRTIVVRTFGVTFRRSSVHRVVPPNAPGWDQLVCATTGMIIVHGEKCSWAVPPHRAIEVPAGLTCRIEMHGEVALRILYFRARKNRHNSCAVVNLTPLLRELILRAVTLGALDATVPAQKHLADVILDELKALTAAPLQLPAPKDPRCQRFSELAAGTLPLPELLRRSGASRRTMERLFRDDTGMSLGQWLRRRKLITALRLLTSHRSIKHVALELGYANPSAFIAMFRRELGQTPTEYFGS